MTPLTIDPIILNEVQLSEIMSFPMKLYRFLTGPDDDAFCMRITEALNNGWQLYGSPTLTSRGNQTIAGQAIIKEVTDGVFSGDIDLKTW